MTCLSTYVERHSNACCYSIWSNDINYIKNDSDSSSIACCYLYCRTTTIIVNIIQILYQLHAVIYIVKGQRNYITICMQLLQL